MWQYTENNPIVKWNKNMKYNSFNKTKCLTFRYMPFHVVWMWVYICDAASVGLQVKPVKNLHNHIINIFKNVLKLLFCSFLQRKWGRTIWSNISTEAAPDGLQVKPIKAWCNHTIKLLGNPQITILSIFTDNVLLIIWFMWDPWIA